MAIGKQRPSQPSKRGLGGGKQQAPVKTPPKPTAPLGGAKKANKAPLTASQLGKRPLGQSQFKASQYDQESIDVTSSIFDLDYKRIMPVRNEPIEMTDGSFMQLMSVSGKDLDTLSEAEVVRTLRNFETWLSTFTDDFQFLSTTLPTNTASQQTELRRHLSQVRTEKASVTPGSRRHLQLEDRERKLLENIHIEEQIQDEIYNAEFVLFLYGPTLAELEDTVRRAQSKGNNDFVPRHISREKKIQILKQYNNQNEKL